jgi:hypothetical protein
VFLVISAVAVIAASAIADDGPQRTDQQRTDGAAWGDDHVGKPFPSFMTGDECLFCHRAIGATWIDNRHQLTIRPADRDDPASTVLAEHAGGDGFADETRYLMGSQRITRFLKRSILYGKLDLLSASFVPTRNDRAGSTVTRANQFGGELNHRDVLHWDTSTFSDRCAGCHTTAVNPITRAFSALSLDCVTCHGDIKLEHTSDASSLLLSRDHQDPRQIVSICGQCHLRGGTSKTTHLPYPNTFVAGDNLFRDFQVDFSDAVIEKLQGGDLHIFLNARDVASFGRLETTCLTCHDVHKQGTEKHQSLEAAAICASCHLSETEYTQLQDSMLLSNRLRVHNHVCDY